MEFKHLNELGWWNAYFAAKLALFFQGLVAFDILGNLGLATLLLLRVAGKVSNGLRHCLALLVALWLLQIDGIFPPWTTLIESANTFLATPSLAILKQWLGAINVPIVLTCGLVLAAYHYLSKFIEVSLLVFAGMLYASILSTNLLPLIASQFPESWRNESQKQLDTAASARAVQTEVSSNTSLNRHLDEFFAGEQTRSFNLPRPAPDGQPFDVVVLSVCSLAWDDLQLSKLTDHPLFKGFDIVFDNFNSATSYSGPALIRMLNGSCGQRPHAALFDHSLPRNCQLFTQLSSIGFTPNLLMNHDGDFDSFLAQLQRYGGLDAELAPQNGLRVAQKSFDGSPIYDDIAVLRRWQQSRDGTPGQQAVLFNTVSLHDGNRIVGSNATGLTSYQERATTLFNQLTQFIQTLENSERNTLLLLVPEHGAGLRGDRMQLPGMREIPAPSITHIPVAAKLIGAQRQGPAARVSVETSYLALSALIANVIQQQPFDAESYTPASLANNLPTTDPVSQNEGSTVLKRAGKYFISLDGKSWTPYTGATR